MIVAMRKDGGARAWSVVAASFFIGFITDGIVYSYGLLFIELLREFKQTKTTSSVIGGIFLGCSFFGKYIPPDTFLRMRNGLVTSV